MSSNAFPQLEREAAERDDEIAAARARIAAFRASTQHTPGVWLIEKALGTGDQDCGLDIGPAIQDGVYRGNVCHVSDAEHIGGISIAERGANARLIAEAPAMLAELRRLAESFGWPEDHPACIVMAKATGKQS